MNIRMQSRAVLCTVLGLSLLNVRAASNTIGQAKSPTATVARVSNPSPSSNKAVVAAPSPTASKTSVSTARPSAATPVTPSQPATVINTLAEDGKAVRGGRIYGTGTEDVIFTVVQHLQAPHWSGAASRPNIYLFNDGLKGEFANTNADAFSDPQNLVRGARMLCGPKAGTTVNLGKIRGEIFIGIITPEIQSVTKAIYKIGPKESNPDNAIHAVVQACSGRLLKNADGKCYYFESVSKYPAGVPAQSAILVGFEEMSSAPEGSGTARWKSDNDLDDVVLAFTSGVTTPDSAVRLTDYNVPAPKVRTARK